MYMNKKKYIKPQSEELFDVDMTLLAGSRNYANGYEGRQQNGTFSDEGDEDVEEKY